MKRQLGALLASILAAACAGLSPAGDSPGTAPAPNTFWTPPPQEAQQAVPLPPPQIPPDLAARIHSMTLVDVVDLALRNSPTTRATWSDARAAAAGARAKEGEYWPTVNLDGSYAKYQTSPTQGRQEVRQSTVGGTVSLSYLLFDFGGRSAAVDVARRALVSADWTHNAAVQNVVLQVELAYHRYQATKALLDAQRATLKEAETNLESANVRHDAGVATIAEVLQAKTALSQAQLGLDSLEGALQTTKGALAVSMGLPANLPFDIEEAPRDVPLEPLMEGVERFIQEAVATRPDLMAARAQAAAALARVKDVRSEGLPTFNLNASAGRSYILGNDVRGNNYSVGLSVHVPLFTGYSQTYKEREAEAQAEAASAREMSLENLVIFQVFASYYSLRTATQRARTANDLLASASASEQVALERYREGVGGILDLLAAESALADARAQQIQVRWDWYGSLAQLAHDTGVLGLRGECPIYSTNSEKDSNP